MSVSSEARASGQMGSSDRHSCRDGRRLMRGRVLQHRVKLCTV